MYNENIKIRYIKEKESTTNTPKDYLTRLFNKTETFEERLEKDICNFTTYEIIDFYKTLNMTSVDSLIVLSSHLSIYTQWCMQQNLVIDCQNHFLEIDSNSFVDYINTAMFKKSIITKNTLYNWLSQLENASDAFIMLALFEGIKGKEFCELVNLKMSDFNGNKVKLCTGRELIVSDKLVSLAKESNDTMIYYSVTAGKEKRVPFLDEDLIIKNYPNCQETNSFYQGRRIYRRLLRNFESMGISKWMKPNSLVDSGKIDFINTRSKELGITAKEYIYNPECVKEFDYRYEYDMTRLRKSFINKYGEYLI